MALERGGFALWSRGEKEQKSRSPVGKKGKRKVRLRSEMESVERDLDFVQKYKGILLPKGGKTVGLSLISVLVEVADRDGYLAIECGIRFAIGMRARICEIVRGTALRDARRIDSRNYMTWD